MPSVSPADRQLLSTALDEARISLLMDSKISVSEVTEPVKVSVYGAVEPLLVRLKEVPGEHQRRALLTKAIIPILERSLPHPGDAPAKVR
ncbi:MAG: hypothetical protein KBC95_03510 [Candidatus Peribacteraceae bacterium]|nr:hypothetical protein [Candidatus Peribacteraceae bacterium]